MKKKKKKSVLTLRREGPKGPEGLHEVSRFSKYLHLKQFIYLNEIKMTSARSTLLLIHFFFFCAGFRTPKEEFAGVFDFATQEVSRRVALQSAKRLCLANFFSSAFVEPTEPLH